jgi:hypothetical protein
VIVLGVLAAAELVLIAFLVMRHAAQVDRLCQRLQAPAAAVLEHDEAARARRTEEYAPPAVEPDDDEAFWMSRDKLAEYAMKAEVDERATG